MNSSYGLKIDVFSHIEPPKLHEAVSSVVGMGERASNFPSLWDLDLRFKIMDKYPGYMQVLSIGTVGRVEQISDPQKSIYLSKLANDEMAGLVLKYPDRFAAAVACLPMNEMDAALQETDRAINELNFRGVQIYTPVSDKPLDSPEFLPLYEKMAKYNLPILIHPTRGNDYPDYRTEKNSKHRISSIFGWPYETTAAMTRLIFGGIFEKFPGLKFITHHGGGMVSFFAGRITQHHDNSERTQACNSKHGLTKPTIDYYKMFYADTALHYNTPAYELAYTFFGKDHLLFGTDMPYDNTHGDRDVRETIRSIEEMNISDIERKCIYEDNVRKLLRLPV